ncbi:MAG: cadmium-containing carbonic anhydrase [Candidatus Beckwithbacteria bacterium]
MNNKEVSSRDKLVAVEVDGLGLCVDGRTAGKKLRGPKIQGGVLGVMALGIGRGDESAVREAIKIIKTAGFRPSVHGDEHHHEEGCGFGRLWSEGKLDNLPRLEISLARVREIVLEEGGEYVVLLGDHREKKVVVNFVENMTLEPDGSSFILDAWVAG